MLKRISPGIFFTISYQEEGYILDILQILNAKQNKCSINLLMNFNESSCSCHLSCLCITGLEHE